MIYTIEYEILYKGNVVGYRIVDENGIESDVSDYFLSFLVRDGFVNYPTTKVVGLIAPC